MCKGKALGALLIAAGIIVLAVSVPGWAWGVVIGILFVTVGTVFVKR